MAKKQGWQKGEGPYSSSKNLGMTRIPDPAEQDSIDRSAIVDKNMVKDGGPAELYAPKGKIQQ